jgi:methylase of polypeptide subunit release factors
MMEELPDIAGLAKVAPADWLALRDRLAAISVDAAHVAPILALSARFPEDDRDPIRLWHLRRRDDAAALAMRLLMFGDALTVPEAIAALDEPLHRVLADAGLLRMDDDAVRCALRLAMAGAFYLFGDELTPGGDVVMGMRDTTIPLWRAIAPTRMVDRVLDIGCGAGALALLLCRHAAQVVASDINPRAVALARINVALNGIDNIDVREGDMFVPVDGETFDLIAAHTAHVALPEGMEGASHMHGGRRGDEMVCALMADLPPHLAPDGIAVVQAHWPLRAGESQAARIRDVAGPDLDLLLLRLDATDADDLATFWGKVHHRGADAVTQIREHYEQLGLAGTEASLAVLRRGTTATPWTAMLEVPPESVAFVATDRIHRLLHSCDLLHGSDEALMAARLRIPEGTTLATIEGLPTGARAMLMLPPATLRKAVEVPQAAQQIIGSVNRAATVGESGQPLAAVREALARGVLEPVEN